MIILKEGQYSGTVTNTFRINGFLTSITAYHVQSYNSDIHYHENAHFSFTLHGGCVEKNGITDNDARMAVTHNPDVKFLMLKILNELLTKDQFSDVSIKMLLLRLIKITPCQGFNNSVPSWVGIIRDFLRSHSDEPITLENLSDISNLHPVTISKQFPKYFACTVGEYKRKLKVEKALKLIQASYSLSEVAYECGFFDQSHFIRTFKRITGFLPHQYQKSGLTN